jgi:AraC-like DNA-binding protein
MIQHYKNRHLEAEFSLVVDDAALKTYFNRPGYLLILWNSTDQAKELILDDRIISVPSQRIIFLTYNQKIDFDHDGSSWVALVFNRAFYCIHTHDSEVSCNGLLFFGTDYSPILSIDPDEKSRLQTLIGVLEDEFEQKDSNQEEMLRLLLKRFIIRCTRLARRQLAPPNASQTDIDLIRQFSFLVEEHFRTKKKVSEYAELLFKSPKTISNVFHIHQQKSPLQIIHDRIILEAKRHLFYTDKSVKEISMELGFEEATQFTKFFKKNTGFTPLDFKNRGINKGIGKN